MTQEWCVEILILTFGYTGILLLTHKIVTELWNLIISAKNPINSHIFRKLDDKSQLTAMSNIFVANWRQRWIKKI